MEYAHLHIIYIRQNIYTIVSSDHYQHLCLHSWKKILFMATQFSRVSTFRCSVHEAASVQWTPAYRSDLTDEWLQFRLPFKFPGGLIYLGGKTRRIWIATWEFGYLLCQGYEFLGLSGCTTALLVQLAGNKCMKTSSGICKCGNWMGWKAELETYLS